MPYCMALSDSIKEHGNVKFYVLNINGIIKTQNDNLNFIDINDLRQFLNKNRISTKYFNEIDDKLRWALKPVIMRYLISEKGYSSVIYIDNDIYFFDKYNFLFEMLNEHSIILTPHWRNINPESNNENDRLNFRLNFQHGLFNAGFIAVNDRALSFLDWWYKCNCYEMKRDICSGFYDDQRFLDVVPIYFEGTHILKHFGCNVSEWNENTLARKLDIDKYLINGMPLVFMHFVQYYENVFNQGREQIIKGIHEKWTGELIRYGWQKPGNSPIKPKNSIKSITTFKRFFLRWISQ
jgi:hypothetical protein